MKLESQLGVTLVKNKWKGKKRRGQEEGVGLELKEPHHWEGNNGG